MDKPRKNLVSLRGASVKEITRDALLEKVAQERELRNYSRRATSSAILIQRVWRGNNLTRKAAKQLREEWESQVQLYTGSKTKTWISIHLLRPFLFFITPLLTQHCSSRTRDIHCTSICFNILLESINAADAKTNFCSLATGNDEERRIWKYQSRKLISLCLYVLRECNISSSGNESLVRVTSLAMRLAVMLSDVKGWKSITKDNQEEAIVQVRKLVQFMEIMHNSLYINIRRYICKLDVHISSEMNRSSQTDAFVITASAVTLALRPFHIFSSDANCSESLDLQHTAELYSRFILTIPWLVQRLPAILLPALRHASVLSPCFRSLMIHKEKILLDSPEIDRSFPNITSQVGWALANIIYLVTGTGKKSASAGGFIHGLDYSLYVRGVMTLTEHLLGSIERSGCLRKENQELEDGIEPSAVLATVICEPETTYGSLKMSYMDLFSSVYQQWHLKVLLGALLKDPPIKENEMISSKNMNDSGKVELNDIVFMYSYMVKIFSVLNPVIGSLPLLNMISFTPGFLPRLWEAAENFLFPQEVYNVKEDNRYTREISSWKNHDTFDGKRKPSIKDGGNRWAAVLHKISGKSQNHADSIGSSSDHDRPSQLNEDPGDLWDVEPLKLGPQNIHKETACLLHLFCASYSHLLLVLDDIEFYEKQVPFSLVQQRRITSMLNTLVYNGLSQGNSPQNRALMDAAIRCLHLLYQRDCRHQFCPPDLWLAPGRKNRPPVAAAARAHEVSKQDATLPSPSMGSVITVTPHVFPFEERVQMFREFINMDKSSRLMAGEVTGRRARTVEIEVRRSHIVEDGFRQLNSLGPGLKSSIHVSFVSDCGLPEAGLDYGGLSKEFLTDIAKAGFSPEFGLFTQTATSDRLIVPNTTARFQENGIQMIEFLGKVVGKALYEGILLEYSFSHVFVQKLLGRYSFLDELSTLDPELYKNLMYVKNFDGDVTELSLDFTVTEEYFGRRHTVELKPGGKDVIVTNENKLQYVHAMADYKLNRQMLPLSNAFYRGLSDLISPSWLKLFNASEFNQLLSGGNYDIDVEDLRSNTRYTGGYSEGNRTIKLFWEVMTGLEPKERCLLLKFVTSCSRAPLLGFKHLQPAFTIHKVACDIPLWAVIGGQDVDRLPSASTCYNTLKLPTYKRSATLREKLLYAISSNAGFELS